MWDSEFQVTRPRTTAPSDTSASARIVFIGAERTGLACLQRLIDMGRNVVGVFTAHEDLRPRIADFIGFPDLNIPLYRIRRSSDPATVAAVAALRPDLIFVISWSQIIPPAIINVALRGCIGIHYSLLPARRGGAPLSWAIIDGLSESGLTLFYMDERLDAGDIIAQKRFAIGPRESIRDLLDKIVILAPDLVCENVFALEDGTAPRLKQDESLVSYTRRRSPVDGEIDWSKPLGEIDRFIRALAPPYPGAFTVLGKHRKCFIDSSELVDGQLRIQGRIE